MVDTTYELYAVRMPFCIHVIADSEAAALAYAEAYVAELSAQYVSENLEQKDFPGAGFYGCFWQNDAAAVSIETEVEGAREEVAAHAAEMAADEEEG